MPDVALCTVAQVKAHAGITGTDRDALIALLIPRALRRFNLAAGREFIRLAAPATRALEVAGHLVSLGNWDLRTATTVTLHPESQSQAQVLTAGTHYELALDTDTATAYAIRLARGLNLWSAHAASFDHAGLSVVGEWGIWADVDAVPADINAAAVAMVRSGLEKVIEDGLDVAGLTSGGGGHFESTWDIPSAAWRALQPYSRELGVS
jgi:hypothetical protein